MDQSVAGQRRDRVGGGVGAHACQQCGDVGVVALFQQLFNVVVVEFFEHVGFQFGLVGQVAENVGRLCR
jgi:hypothetical protein